MDDRQRISNSNSGNNERKIIRLLSHKIGCWQTWPNPFLHSGPTSSDCFMRIQGRIYKIQQHHRAEEDPGLDSQKNHERAEPISEAYCEQ